MSTELAVQYANLPEWLLSRRLIPQAYPRLLPGLDAKVSEALAEKVSDKAANELIQQHREGMNYFAVKEIYEAVAKSPEGQAKSLLGAHTHPGAAKWRAALDAFRKKNLGWINIARILIQNVTYEIPALKKHAASCERQVQECNQRQSELVRVEANAKSRHEKLLAELGILGLDPRRELRATAKEELPRMRSELVGLLRGSGSDLLAYYGAFAAHAASAPEVAEQVLPMLRVITRDTQLSLEDVEREVPALRTLRDEAPRRERSAPAAARAAKAAEVAQPAAAEDAGGGSGIDWDFEVSGGGAAAASPGAAGGIDWGIEVSGGGDQGAEPAASGGAGDAGGGIDWGGITCEGLELGAQGSAEDEGAAPAANAADDLLSDPYVRELLYQDVAEVGAFLLARSSELASSPTAEYGPKDAEKSLDDVKSLADIISRAEELMAGRTTQRLLLCESSDRYVEQQVKRIDISKSQCAKPVAQRASLDKAKAEQMEEAKRTYAEIDTLRRATHKLQKDLEAEMSSHFKASFRIVGEISQI